MKILLILCFFLLSACSSFEQREDRISLDNYSHYYLQPVPKVFWGQASLQKLLITTPQDRFELLLQTELRPNRIDMVGLSTAGIVLFELKWSNELGLATKTHISTQGVEAQVMLAYLQLANWPLKSVQQGLNNLQVGMSDDNIQKRQFFRQDQLVFDVISSQQHTLMTHYLDHYQIEITSLQQSKIEM